MFYVKILHLYLFFSNRTFSKKEGFYHIWHGVPRGVFPPIRYMEKGLDPVLSVREGGACGSCGFRFLPGLEMAENGTFIDPGERCSG